MSLKAFHILFVSLSTLICVGLGVWGTVLQERSGESLAMGALGYAGAIALSIYGIKVFKKLRAL
jgi:hypothetical protein